MGIINLSVVIMFFLIIISRFKDFKKRQEFKSIGREPEKKGFKA